MSAGFRRSGGYGLDAAVQGTAALGLFVWIGLAAGCQGTDEPVFLTLAGRPVAAGPNVLQKPSDAGQKRDDDEDGGAPPGPSIIVIEDADAGSNPDPGLDPNVNFTWQQSLPGQGTCKAGHYVGKFDCTLQGDLIDDPAPELSGGMQFMLVAGSAEDATLTIAKGGDVSGTTFFGGLAGTLRCADNSFSADTTGGHALLSDGVSLFPSFNAGFTGKLDRQTLIIEGTLSMSNEMGQTCTGEFSARIAP